MLDGLVALVEAAGVAAGLTGLTVKALSAGDVQTDGELRLAPPAAAVYLEAGAMQAASTDGRTYADTPLWSVLIVGQDLAGGAASAKAAYAILDAVRGYLAGKVITAGSQKALVLLQGYETVVVGGGRAVLRLGLQLDTSFQGS
jgi:hypothetical protein